MKTIVKRVSILLLIFCMVPLVLAENAFAATKEEDDVLISKIILVEDGVATEITYEDYIELTADEEDDVDDVQFAVNGLGEESEIEPEYSVSYYYKYTGLSTSSKYLPEVRVSNIYKNASSLSVTSTVTKSRTVTDTNGLTLTSTLQSTIFSQISATYGYSKSATSSKSTSVTGTFSPSGEYTYSAVYFRPRVRVITGTVKYYTAYNGTTTLISSIPEVEAQYPYTLSSGVLDGIYYIKESNYTSSF